MSYPAISLATATVGRYRCPQKRLQTARQPPVYPNSSPRIIAPVTPSPPSAALTPSIPVHRWIRAYYNTKESVDGEWYIFITDESDVTIAHATVPDNIGQSIRGPLGVDSTGYAFGAVMADATEEGMWVSYVYLNQVTGEEGTKHSWVVERDGLVFGSGWYEPTN